MTTYDFNTMKAYGDAIRQIVPTLDVNVSDFNGEVRIKGNIIFNTQGRSSVAVVSAYLIGMWVGLNKGNNPNPGL